jgi:hypothetical protein
MKVKTKKQPVPEHLKFDTYRYNLYAIKHHAPNSSIKDSGEFVQIHFVVLDNHAVGNLYPFTTATTFVMDSYKNLGQWSKIIRELNDGYVLKLQENNKGFWTVKQEFTDYRCNQKPTMVINADNNFQISKQWLKDKHDHAPLFSLIENMHNMAVEIEKQNDVIDLDEYIKKHTPPWE